MKANIQEIFCSIQGEGILVGTKQVFMRLGGCNLRCSYCDTTNTFKKNRPCHIYPHVGNSSGAKQINNPVSAVRASEIVQGFSAPWLSFTGGEPLLEADYLREVIMNLSPNNYKFILETNGTLPEQLEKIIHHLDYVSMDIKLPSLVRANFFEEHEKFLAIAEQKPCYVKIVVTSQMEMDEFNTALKIIKKINPNIPLFIQPVTPREGESKPDIFKLISWQNEALKFLKDVRILPQIHPWLGLN